VPGISAVHMKAWPVGTPGPEDEHPLVEADRLLPALRPVHARARVEACAVDRPDLHLAEGNLAPEHRLVAPGHQQAGNVERMREGATLPVVTRSRRTGQPVKDVVALTDLALAHRRGHCPGTLLAES
jgi:D-arabinose 1-dehydrogenase-like Zn-dependent alcohol dehydrogenase